MTTSTTPVPAHTLTVETVAEAMEVGLEVGLTTAQALERLARHGPNRVPEAPLRSPWRVLLGQFKSILILFLILILILIWAAALAGSVKDAVVILAEVVISALVGCFQEYRAERRCEAGKLRKRLTKKQASGVIHGQKTNNSHAAQVPLSQENRRPLVNGSFRVQWTENIQTGPTSGMTA